jgi:hypothetical protein
LFTREEIDKVWEQNLFIGCNMARGPLQHYKQFFTTLFVGLIPLWEEHRHFFPLKGYDKRAIAYIAERLITGMVLYRDKFFQAWKSKQLL